MGKRSNFAGGDNIVTPYITIPPIIPFLKADGINRFIEPCAGDHDMVEGLEHHGLRCGFAGDLKMGWDARDMTASWFRGIAVDGIVTNPPWSKERLCPLLDTFLDMGHPVWLLLYGDWMHNKWAVPYLRTCSHIVAIGRVRWIVGSRFTGKENAVWMRFHQRHWSGPRFYGRGMSPDMAVETQQLSLAEAAE